MPLTVDSVQTGRFYNQAGTREFAPCTAWVNFDGTGTVAIRDSLNVSSITDNGTGDYTVSFSQTMDNANYAVSTNAAQGENNGSTDSIGVKLDNPISSPGSPVKYDVNGFRLLMQNSSGINYDSIITGASVFGGITL